MRAIIIVMLAVQLGGFLAAAGAILFGRKTAARGRPVWSSLAISLTIIAATSLRIADSHAGQPGADLLMFGAPFLLGVGITCAMMLIRQRRGLDDSA